MGGFEGMTRSDPGKFIMVDMKSEGMVLVFSAGTCCVLMQTKGRSREVLAMSLRNRSAD